MNISGWAFTENESELAEANRNIYNTVQSLNFKDYVVIETVDTRYAKKTYKGYLKPDHPSISETELAIFLDTGNLCFGGASSISDNKFIVTIYTD